MVPVADRPECAQALVTAFDLAERFSGNVIGYHLRPHRKEERRSSNRTSDTPLRQFDWQGQATPRQLALDSKNAKRLFSELAARYHFKLATKARYSKKSTLALWHEVTGDPDHIFSIVGPLSDLVVVSRPKSKRSVKARAFASAALTHSGRPVLMVPQRKAASIGQHVLIAWNQSEQAAATVMASIPLLVNAETVTIVAALRKSHLGPGVSHLQQMLQLHGVDASVIKTPGLSPQDEIVQAFVDSGSDLLMMGAYSRSAWKERVFGGVTQHILDNTQLPCVLMHT
jgi:nucleotide-binding universal stress UspA family protein